MILEDPNYEKKIILYVIVGILALILSVILVIYM